MDRIALGFLIVGVSVFWAITPANADTVLAPPAHKPGPAPAGENFPSSRFGSPPAPIETGVRSGFASRAVEEMEESDEEEGSLASTPSHSSQKGQRRPAGLEFHSPSATTSMIKQERLEKPSNTTPEAGLVSRKGVQEVALIASDLGFFPKVVFVSREVPVRIFVTGASKNALCIMMDSFQVRKQVRSQKIEEITFTPNVPGKYRFYCPVNGMEGTLIVKEFASITGEMGVNDPSTNASGANPH